MLSVFSNPNPIMSLLEGDSMYEEIAVIGTGAYGTVYKARDPKNNGQFVAIKRIRIQTSSDEGIPISTLREVSSLKKLKEHPNIVKLLDVCFGGRNNNEMRLSLVFEHIDQDLQHYLERCPAPGLGPDRIRDLMMQMLSGVDFLHSNRIVHRDLKPQNVLVSSSGQVKLADFGLARVYGFTMALTSVVVTLWYRSPEVLLQAQYGTKVDIWSCGCIFVELHTRRPLFCGQSDIDQLYKIFDIIGLPPQHDWPENVSLPWSSFKPTPRIPFENLVPDMEPEAKHVLEKMLDFNQDKRYSALEVLNHPYFRDEEEEEEEEDSSMSLNDSQDTSSHSDNMSADLTDTSHSTEDTQIQGAIPPHQL